MKTLSLEQMEKTEGGKFWGESCGPSYNIGNQCYKNCSYYVFWISVSFDVVPC
jgi:hypothetical protein